MTVDKLMIITQKLTLMNKLDASALSSIANLSL